MKRFFAFVILFIFVCLPIYAENKTLSAGVSIEEIPKAFFGCWIVRAKLDDTNNYKIFKPQSIDTWTLCRVGDKITLNNSFTGATADISIKAVEGNLMVFSKKAAYDNKTFIDTVSIRLEEGKFSGINTLTIETNSLIDNHLMKTEFARYKIYGEKIAGESVIEE